MKIYTKTGDTGDTSLLGGARVPKSSLRVEAYGTIDELNAHLGVVCALIPGDDLLATLERIQSQLFVLSADLAAPLDITSAKLRRIQQDHISYLETTIDRFESQLEPLNNFILPGGTSVGAELHVARAVCRRAERLVDALGRKEEIGRSPLIYLNRLADLLFVLARYVNKNAEFKETLWMADPRE